MSVKSKRKITKYHPFYKCKKGLIVRDAICVSCEKIMELFVWNLQIETTTPALCVPVGRLTFPLSFSTTIIRERKYPALFISSYDIPPVIVPSPITAIQLF